MVLAELDCYSHCFSQINCGFARHKTQNAEYTMTIGWILFLITLGHKWADDALTLNLKFLFVKFCLYINYSTANVQAELFRIIGRPLKWSTQSA